MAPERAGYTVTMFVIDVSPSMGKERTTDLPPGPEGEPRTKTITNLAWSLQFVLLKIQEMIFNGRKTDQCGVILFGTTKTSNCINRERGGYDHVTEYIPIGQPTARTLDLVSAIRPSTVEGDALDGLIVAIQTQAEYLGRKASWTRRITLITDGESPLVTSDWEDTADKVNELEVYLTLIGVDFDDEEFTEEGKSKQKRENEKFYHQLEGRVTNALLGSCYQALEDCALPEVKQVKPAAKTVTVSLGDTEVNSEDAIEISARVYKVTSKAASVTLKKYVKRDVGSQGPDQLGDIEMEDAEAPKTGLYALVERETKYFVRPPPPDKDVKAETQEDGEPVEEEKLGEQVDSEDLVRGYKYGATWVLVEEEFERMASKAGIEVIGFMHASKLNRSYLMGEIYSLIADPASSKSQIALSSFIRAMVIKDVLAIVRWTHANDAEPKMAICSPVVESTGDFLLMSRVPFAEDVRNYTFPSMDNLVNKKGEVASKHPFITTDAMVSAMEKWVGKMDLMEASREDDGTPEPWFDMSRSYNPAIHRTKQALFHAAIVTDLDSNPLPPPHPELTKYLEPPSEVVERSAKALEKLKKVLDVKLVPPKARGKKRVNEIDATEHAGDDFSVADLLGEDFSQPPELEASGSMAGLSLKSPYSPKKSLEAEKGKSKEGSDTEDEDEVAAPVRGGMSHLPTPGRSPTAPPPRKRAASADRDTRPGRIIGNAFPLDDFRRNLEQGDVVSKALKDMAAIIPEIVEESFSTQRYDEAIQCMREMRKTALEEDDIDIWNNFIQEFKKKCQSNTFKHKDFWERVQGIGMSISLITEKEADRHEGYSPFSELQSVQFISS